MKQPHFKRLCNAIGILAALAALACGILALFVVPAPSARTAVQVSGTLVSLSRPQSQQGDLGIVLDNGQSYYVNRVGEADYFAWEEMLADVQPGDRLYLTVVHPLAWRLAGTEGARHLPVAGIRSEDTVYMDPAISADLWTAQARFCRAGGITLLILMLCMLPDLMRWLRRRRPASALSV